jgi:hypothetical protein
LLRWLLRRLRGGCRCSHCPKHNRDQNLIHQYWLLAPLGIDDALKQRSLMLMCGISARASYFLRCQFGLEQSPVKWG